MWRTPKPENLPAEGTLVSTRALANLLSVTPATVRKWRQNGTGPPTAQLPPGYPLPGKQVLYHASAIREWLAGDVRHSKHWKGLTIDPLHDLDDTGRAILAASKRAMIGATAAERAPGGSAYREAARLRRKLTSRARYLAAADTNPGEFEHQFTANQQGDVVAARGVIDAEFEEQPHSQLLALPKPQHGQLSQQQLIRAPMPLAHPRLIGHVNPRPPTPSNAAAQLTGSNRDRELLAELLALPPSERPAF